MVIIKEPTPQKDRGHKALAYKIIESKKIATKIYRLIKHLAPFIRLNLQTIDHSHKTKAPTSATIIFQINDVKKASIRKRHPIAFKTNLID